MCGIAGRLAANPDTGFADKDASDLRSIAVRMSMALTHRGPDDSGVWVDESAGIAFAHRRLSILDLSPAGHQPMVSASGRFVIVFNGEIYNHRTLRNKLAFHNWQGYSDTETLLACLTEWGVEKTLQALVGMFAFALWDRETEKLFLARDRLGEKPLYYGYVGGIFAFASELKAFRVLPGFSAEVDRGALALFMRYNAIPAPYCIFRGLAKLLPGTWLELTPSVVGKRKMPEPQIYWSALDVAKSCARTPLFFDSDALAIDALEEVLSRAVAGQMVADVPLGAFLSGGVDSSTIVAVMQAQSTQAVKTFSIGFYEGGYDEAGQARAVARHLGTEHTELYVTPEEAMAMIPKLPTIYDEPFADPSQIPTYIVAAMTKQHVTVALSGDGGDELFGGYNRHFLAAGQFRLLQRLPLALRRGAVMGIQALSPQRWNWIAGTFDPLFPAKYKLRLPGDKLYKAAAVLDSKDGTDLYRRLVTHWSPESVVLGGEEPPTALGQPWPTLPDLAEQMMALDAVTYLPDDILVKVDRAAMAVSLETRVPFLDHRVFEFAWRLPLRYKVRDGIGKWILRQVLCRHVPQALIDQPKMGFGVPIDSWLRGPLREWAEGLLNEKRIREEGFFDSGPIRKKWQEHLSGRRNWQYHLWDVLMFQAWLEKN